MTTIWIDAHLSPAIATWIMNNFEVTAVALRDLGLRDAEDPEIFEAAKSQGAIFMTKDRDFVDLVDRIGTPPQIIWLTCGNTSNHLVNLWQHLKYSVERDFKFCFDNSARNPAFW